MERRCREEERGDKCTYDVTNMHRVFKGEGGVSEHSFVPKKQLKVQLVEGEYSDQVRALHCSVKFQILFQI